MTSSPDSNTECEIFVLLDECNIKSPLRDYFIKCSEFHSYPAPGMLIGVFMVDLALELINAKPDERLYAVSETRKCAPDPLQVITHCTTGNHRLRIVQTGRFAITLNRGSRNQKTEGVRVYVDLKKIEKFPMIHTWITKKASFHSNEKSIELNREILKAGREILSWEKVLVSIPKKEQWNSLVCPTCGELFPDINRCGSTCGACGPLRYYEAIS